MQDTKEKGGGKTKVRHKVEVKSEATENKEGTVQTTQNGYFRKMKHRDSQKKG